MSGTSFEAAWHAYIIALLLHMITISPRKTPVWGAPHEHNFVGITVSCVDFQGNNFKTEITITLADTLLEELCKNHILIIQQMRYLADTGTHVKAQHSLVSRCGDSNRVPLCHFLCYWLVNSRKQNLKISWDTQYSMREYLMLQNK